MLSRVVYSPRLPALAPANLFALSCLAGMACAVAEAVGVQLHAPRAREAWVQLARVRVALAAYAYTPPFILGLFAGAAWLWLCATQGLRGARFVRAAELGAGASMWTAWLVLVLLHRAGELLLLVGLFHALQYQECNRWSCGRLQTAALLWGLSLLGAPPPA